MVDIFATFDGKVLGVIFITLRSSRCLREPVFPALVHDINKQKEMDSRPTCLSKPNVDCYLHLRENLWNFS